MMCRQEHVPCTAPFLNVVPNKTGIYGFHLEAFRSSTDSHKCSSCTSDLVRMEIATHYLNKYFPLPTSFWLSVASQDAGWHFTELLCFGSPSSNVTAHSKSKVCCLRAYEALKTWASKDWGVFSSLQAVCHCCESSCNKNTHELCCCVLHFLHILYGRMGPRSMYQKPEAKQGDQGMSHPAHALRPILTYGHNAYTS